MSASLAGVGMAAAVAAAARRRALARSFMVGILDLSKMILLVARVLNVWWAVLAMTPTRSWSSLFE